MTIFRDHTSKCFNFNYYTMTKSSYYSTTHNVFDSWIMYTVILYFVDNFVAIIIIICRQLSRQKGDKNGDMSTPILTKHEQNEKKKRNYNPQLLTGDTP